MVEWALPAALLLCCCCCGGGGGGSAAAHTAIAAMPPPPPPAGRWSGRASQRAPGTSQAGHATSSLPHYFCRGKQLRQDNLFLGKMSFCVGGKQMSRQASKCGKMSFCVGGKQMSRSKQMRQDVILCWRQASLGVGISIDASPSHAPTPTALTTGSRCSSAVTCSY